MGKAVQNIAVILGLATLAFAGYYMYTQQAGALLQTNTDEATMQRMLSNTEQFIQYRRELSEISFNLALFEDPRFTTLRSYTEPIAEQPVGRPNPFAPANAPVFQPPQNPSNF